ncbi:S-layer family protein [Neisseria meningitidis]|nr:S-layer family protein [Neisseria meningitidis]
MNKPSRLTGRTGVSIHAAAALDDARIIIGASEIKAPSGSIDIKAHSDIVLEAGQNDAYTFLKTKGKSGKIIRKTKFTSTRDHLIMPAPVELTANGITLQAGGNIEANTTRFNAPAGKVTLVAGEELQLLAEEGIHKHELDVQKSRRFIGIKVGKSNYSKNELNETKLPVRVVAQTAATRSGWDTVLEGTEFKTTLAGADIQAGVGEKARADAKIILKGIVNRIQSEEKLETNSTVWQKQAGRGSTIETLKLPSFESPTPPKLSAPGGYIVDIPKGNLKTEIEKLAKQPEYAYLKQLQTAKNVDWKQVQLAYDKWDYKQEGLTGAGAAIVVIIVTALTYGYGAAAAGSVTAAGSSTAATTTAAATTTVSTAAAMQTAALASLYSQAAVAIINNKGDVGKALKDLGTSDTVKQIVTSALTAGALNQMGADIAQLNSKVRTELFSSTGNQTIANLGGRLATNLSNAGISAGINTAVNGGSLKDNLGNAALGALVNSFQGEAASKIKTTFSDDYVAKQFAHALAGCVSGLVQGKCKDGAIGAAVGEIVAESILGGRNPATLSDAEKHKVISYSKIIAGSVAALNGGDVNTAANAAEVAVVNNALNFDSTPTNAKKHQPQKPDKTALEKIIQSIMPAHAAGAMTNPQDKDAAIWISNIRNGITGPIVITSYGVYAAGWTAPLIGTAGKAAISTCMANPSGCTVMVTQAAEAGAGIATGAVTVGNAWEAPVGALSKAKAAKQAIPTQTVKELDGLLQESKNIGAVNTRINIANSTTRYTPMRQTGQPVSAGFEHVLEGHFHRPIANNRSVFTISPNELKVILQSNKVVSSPVSMTPDGQYMRTVDVGKVIGTTSIKEGGQPTTTIKVFTDKSGNLITTYPVKGN